MCGHLTPWGWRVCCLAPTRLRLNTTPSCDCRIAQKERASIDHQSTKLLSSFGECKLKIGRRLTSTPHHVCSYPAETQGLVTDKSLGRFQRQPRLLRTSKTSHFVAVFQNHNPSIVYINLSNVPAPRLEQLPRTDRLGNGEGLIMEALTERRMLTSHTPMPTVSLWRTEMSTNFRYFSQRTKRRCFARPSLFPSSTKRLPDTI